MKESDQEKLDRYKREFYADYGAFEEQRDKSNEEMRFQVVPGGQWEGFLEAAYADRAKLELDQVSDYVYRTYGNWTQNRIGVRYTPDDGITSDDDAELLNGLYRRDFRRSQGEQAVDCAVLEAMQCGVGAFQLATEYDDAESVDDDTMNVSFRALPNAYSTVVWDSGAKLIDKSDAKRCTLLFEYSRTAFEEEYPDAVPASAMTPDDRREYNWTTNSTVTVACRYDVVRKKDVAYTVAHMQTGERDVIYKSDGELDNILALGFEVVMEKRIERRFVEKTLFSGAEILEPTKRIAGKYIPVVPVYGYRSYVDGSEYYNGLVRKRMDGQRLFNMEVSRLAENSANAHKRIPIMDPRQVQGLEAHWAGDISRKPYLPLRPLIDKSGAIVQTGPSGFLEPDAIDPHTAALVELTATFINAGTGGAPQETIDPDVSGKAISAIIQQIDLNTQPIMDNVKVAIKWAGIVYREIARDIYASPRTIKTVAEDGSESTVRLMEVSADPQTGNPVYANDLSRGKFEVVVSTGPQYQTKREATVETLKDIYASLTPDDPNRPIVLGMLIENLDGVGIDDLREYNRNRLLSMGIRKPESDEERQFVEQLRQQQQGQQDPQQALIAAATQQQLAEAQEKEASAYNKIADAEYKRARAIETVDGMKTKRMQMALDALRR